MSVCEPNVTVEPDATFSAAIVNEKPPLPAGAAMGTKLMMAGAPPPDGAKTVSVILFETRGPLATETLTVPAAETSLAGTMMVIVQPDGRDTSQATLMGGESVSLPKRTVEVPIKSVPVIDSVKLPEPAVTLIGERERMVGVMLDGGVIFPPPQPEKKIGILTKDPRRRTALRLITPPPAASTSRTH